MVQDGNQQEEKTGHPAGPMASTATQDLGSDNNDNVSMDISTDDEPLQGKFSDADDTDDPIEILASTIAWYKPWAFPIDPPLQVVPRDGARVHPLDPRGQKRQPIVVSSHSPGVR